MADRHQLNVTLPDDMADQIRARVATGQYASESDVVIEALRTLEDREPTLEQWLRTEVAAAYDAIAADPSRGLSLDQVRSSLAATHDRLAAAAAKE
jgi:antitoxin ParD1/3/4